MGPFEVSRGHQSLLSETRTGSKERDETTKRTLQRVRILRTHTGRPVLRTAKSDFMVRVRTALVRYIHELTIQHPTHSPLPYIADDGQRHR